MTVGPGFGAGVPRAQMRASTVDRDRAVEVITRAYTEGRLTKDEHDARVERAMTAATFAELDLVVIDLPGAGPPQPPAQVVPAARRTNPPSRTQMAAAVVRAAPVGQVASVVPAWRAAGVEPMVALRAE